MQNGGRLLLTGACVVGPDLLLLRSTGWTSLAEVIIGFAWAAIASALVVMTAEDHRRPDFPAAPIVAALLCWVTWGATLLASAWDTRIAVAALLVLPGAIFLLLETLGWTPVQTVPP